MKFDLILANPPFQDSTNRGKTPHKLWIDFTRIAFEKLLVQEGYLHQVSPASFQSPSNKVLQIFKDFKVIYIDLRTSKFFPEVGSTFSHYLVQNLRCDDEITMVYQEEKEILLQLNEHVFYLPNDLCAESISIHKKFMFSGAERFDVKWDYVSCHNILLKRSDTLSKVKTEKHVYPVFHTNNQIWWSQIKQKHLEAKKVMWTRSGYFKPFFDDGTLGGTDMAYYIEVKNITQGKNLASNLNLKLPQYIFKTAKWSGFGNEKVFSALPKLPLRKMTDPEMYSLFQLSESEVDYVEKYME